jgi:hypothetical protein
MIPDLTLRTWLSGAGRRVRVPRLLPAFVVALMALALGCGGAKQERHGGDEVYAALDKAFQPLRRDFEDGDGKVRLVGIVQPTCGDCIDMTEAIDARLLPAIPDEDFEVYLVWVCAMPADVELRAKELSEKYANPRIRHYWDGSGRISRAFGKHVGLPDGTHAYAIFYLYGRSDTWDPEHKMANDPPGYNAVLEGWQPSEPRARQGAHPMIRLPRLDADALRPLVERLLAEPDPGAAPR